MSSDTSEGFPKLNIDPKSDVPKYAQLVKELETLIVENKISPNSKIPSENELFALLQISRSTIRRALEELELRGLLYKRQGQGTFVGNRLLAPDHVLDNRRRLNPLQGEGSANKKSIAAIGTVSVILPTLSNEIYPEIIRGVEEVARSYQFEVFTSTSWSDPAREFELIQHVLAQGTRGLIIEPTRSADSVTRKRLAQLLMSLPIPFVVIDDPIPEIESATVMIDDVQAGALAVRHLIELGHRRIAYIYKHEIEAAEHRFEGYKKALEHASIPFDPTLVRSYAEDQESLLPGYILTKELLESSQPPTAIFYFNDDLAVQGYRAVQDAGKEIPQDVSLVGFDNITWAKSSQFNLTTINHPKHMMGRWAADILFETIHQNPGEMEGSSYKLLIQPRLIKRRSSGPAPRS